MSHSSSLFLPEQQLLDLLDNLGIIVSGDTGTDIIAYCPFHNNKDSPAFNISKGPWHLWRCHNGRCNKAGNIISLLTLKGYSKADAERMILKGSYEIDDLVKLVQQLMAEDKEDEVSEWRNIDPNTFRDADRDAGWKAKLYLQSRGITEQGYDFFQIGYAPSKSMLTIPVFNDCGTLVGVIGRSINEKRYQYSTGLARGQLIWNIHSAKKYGESIILTEGALDAIYIWQAGFSNVGAVFGSSISPKQWSLIKKYFMEVICFFDNDEAGIALRDMVAEEVRDLSVSFVEYPKRMVVQGDKEREIKDPGELTEEEIKSMIDNRISSLMLLMNG